MQDLQARAITALRSASMLADDEKLFLIRELADQARKLHLDQTLPGTSVRAMAALIDRQDGFQESQRRNHRRVR